eukprot:364100-Chlamydomonas_euryale.AAC.61
MHEGDHEWRVQESLLQAEKTKNAGMLKKCGQLLTPPLCLASVAAICWLLWVVEDPKEHQRRWAEDMLPKVVGWQAEAGAHSAHQAVSQLRTCVMSHKVT